MSWTLSPCFQPRSIGLFPSLSARRPKPVSRTIPSFSGCLSFLLARQSNASDRKHFTLRRIRTLYTSDDLVVEEDPPSSPPSSSLIYSICNAASQNIALPDFGRTFSSPFAVLSDDTAAAATAAIRVSCLFT